MTLSRHGLKLLTVLAVITMLSLEPWPAEVYRSRGVWPIVPARPTETRPAPTRMPLPRASKGRNGPEAPVTKAPPPKAAPQAPALPRTPAPRPVTPRTKVAVPSQATIAARQRYLDNVYLLAQLIHGEARGEPYIGQVAVGAVVMNRVESPRYPNTMAGVIYEPGAFDAVIDGQMFIPPDQEAVRAAKAAIAGWDPTYGALFYYNPAKTTSYWIWDRPIILVIGRHYFAR